MLSVYVPRGTTLVRNEINCASPLPEDVVWIDLMQPTPEERKKIERALSLSLPTLREMQEIEVTSRLYVENGARYMTATLLAHQDTERPTTTPITFILTGHRLVTVRYEDPRPFVIADHRLARSCPTNPTGETAMMAILDAVTDRAADILERIGADVDDLSRSVFEPEHTGVMRAQSYSQILVSIGQKGDLTSKVRESLVSIGRMLVYLFNEADVVKWTKEQRAVLKGMQRDVQSLSDHASYLSNKIQFLLDALLGVVSIQQNNIIKIFSIAAVVFLPPTLVASIYGMNFHYMPELDWVFGYPFAGLLMLAAAIGPYLFFKSRKWL